MSGIELAQVSALIIFLANALLLSILIGLKTIHRRRMIAHDRRRSGYVALLSRHLTFEDCTDPITPSMAQDSAFLDALIDVRNAVVGPEIQTLRGILNRHGVIEQQARRLRSSFPLGRRLRAAVALAEIGDESAAPILVEHLGDREPEVRIQAARGLGRIKWTPAIDIIVSGLSQETPWVMARYADTLIGFGTKATSPLLAYIRVNQRFETAGPVTAIRTLAAIGDMSVAPTLIEILREAQDPEVIIATIETLGILGSPTAAPVIRSRARSSDWTVRAKAVTALGDLRDEQSLDLLGNALTDPNWWVRRNSAAALTQIPGGIDRLYDALTGADRYAADAAAEALFDSGELGQARLLEEEGRLEPHHQTLLAHMAGSA